MSAAPDKSSSTTSQRHPVSPSQLTKRPAIASASAPGSVPSAISAASAYTARTEARLVAGTQTSTFTSRDRQRDSAKDPARWLLPDDPSQYRHPRPAPRPGPH